MWEPPVEIAKMVTDIFEKMAIIFDMVKMYAYGMVFLIDEIFYEKDKK